jgi:S1-C subfamily serine protease
VKTRICFLLIAFIIPFALADDDPVVSAVQKALPAVVNISTEQLIQRFGRDPFEDLFRQFFGQQRQGIQSLGSGVIVDGDGWIVTNYHVVRRASKITVTMADGTSYEAKFVSGDEKNDLALLKIEPKQPLPFIELDGASEPLLGQTVIAIGNPFGFDHTVTKGIISAKNRKFPPDDPKFEDVLQTDAAINPGNSGGPLINTRGELVGINTAILSQAEGIGFAIPAKRVANLLSTWFSPEKRARAWLGLRFERENGKIVVTDVQPESPAGKAGIQPHRVIAVVDDRRFADVLQLQRYLMHKKPGDEVRFDEVKVKLAALPKLSTTEMMQKKFGVGVQPLTDDLADALGISSAQGLLITDVQRGSPGAEAGLRRGVVITHFAGEEIQSGDGLAEQLADVKTGDAVNLVIFVSERRGTVTLQQTGKVTLKAR